jgi:hypothetical protein
MSRIVRADPYLTREDTGADEGQTPAIQYYSKQNGSDGATSNTVFTLSKSYVLGSNTLVIYVNGQKAELLTTATDETEYEETSTTTVTFGASLLDTDVVEFMIYGTYFIQDIDQYQVNNNIIINGDCQIWQRGTSFAAIANAAYFADRFFYGKIGTMVHTITRDTDVPTVAQSNHTSNYSIKMDCTTADASIAAGDLCAMQYRVEGFDQVPLTGKYGTLSFWVKGVKTGTHCVAFISGSNDASYVVEYTINTASTWEKKEITVLFNDSAGTWNTTTGVGMTIAFAAAVGSTFQTTADAWQSGQYYGTSSQVNACDHTDNNLWLSQVKLELGQTATKFTSRPFAQELALCQRYFEKSSDLDVFVGDTDANGDIYELATRNVAGYTIGAQFLVSKRETPSIVLWNPVTGNTGKIANSGDKTGVAGGIGFNGFGYVTITSGSAAAGAEYQYSAEAEL